MFSIKNTLAFVLFFLAVSAHGQRLDRSNWLIEKSSNITINGVSNVTDFACTIGSESKKDTLLLSVSFERTSEKFQFHDAEIQINATNFDCQNKLITEDFRNTLQVEKHPYIYLNFISLETPTEQRIQKHELEGEVKITIVEVSKFFKIKFDVEQKSNGTLSLAGKKEVLFKDFGLKPPRKLAGLVKVEEELGIDFNLLLIPLK